MRLEKIGCTGIDDSHSFEKIVQFGCLSDRLEIGIAICLEKSGNPIYPTPEWIENYLSFITTQDFDFNHVLHINGCVMQDFLVGKLHPVLKMILAFQNKKQSPAIKRIQLNIENDFNVLTVKNLVKKLSDFKISLSFNEQTKDIIDKAVGQFPFDILVDSSGGNGVLNRNWPKQIYPTVLQGYAGGLTPQNVQENLSLIAQKLPQNTPIWIDAEGGLKGADGHMSFDKASRYVQNALAWFP